MAADPAHDSGRVAETVRQTSANELLAEFISLLGGRSGTDVLDALLERSRKLTGAEAGILYVLRRCGEDWMLVAASTQNDDGAAVSGEAVASHSIPIRPGGIVPAVRAVESGQPILLGPGEAGRNSAPEICNGCWSGLAFPLRSHGGDVVGVMQLMKRRETEGARSAFAEADASVFDPVNAVIGDAVERAEMTLRLAASNAELRQRNRELARQKARIEALGSETESAFEISVTLLAKAAELHDEDTGNHILRLDRYAEKLAERLGLPEDFRKEISYSAALHDVGKMSVDAAVLKKPGPLTLAERTEMERHTIYGYQILRQSERLHMAAEIALCHHERWDGSGYPRGLSGDKIPLAARIVAVADVYDALRSPRPYKTARTHKDAIDWMLYDLGHFDPVVLRCFVDHHLDFESIYERLLDQRGRFVL